MYFFISEEKHSGLYSSSWMVLHSNRWGDRGAVLLCTKYSQRNYQTFKQFLWHAIKNLMGTWSGIFSVINILTESFAKMENIYWIYK